MVQPLLQCACIYTFNLCIISAWYLFLLQSANFGKGFLGPDVSNEVVNEFVEMCYQMQVLNNVRDELIGMPITLRQYP